MSVTHVRRQVAYIVVITSVAVLVYLFSSESVDVGPDVKTGSSTSDSVVNTQVSTQAGGNPQTTQNSPIEYAANVFNPANDAVADRLRTWVTDIHFRGKMHKGYVRHDIVEFDVNALTEIVSAQFDVISPGDLKDGLAISDIQLPIDLSIADDKNISVLFNKVSVVAPGKYALQGHMMANPNNTQIRLTIDQPSGRLLSGQLFDGTNSHVFAATPEPPYYLVTEATPRPTLVDDEITR